MELNQKKIRYISLSIVALCIFSFFPVFKAGFVNYDDTEYILNNNYIKHFSLHNIKAIFAGKATILYIPLTLFSYMLEYSLFGQNAGVFHTVNLFLHISNALLLFAILRRLNIRDIYLIGFILLFFTLSPLVTESVCWVTERKDMLYCFFFFLSISQFLKYEESAHIKHLVYAFLFFILSCLSKPMAVSLPVLFLFYWLYRKRSLSIKRVLYLVPFFTISGFFAIISVIGIKTGTTGKIVLTTYSLDQKLILLFSELGYYFFKPFFPFNQQLIHFFPEKEHFFDRTLLMAFALAGLLLFCIIGYKIFKQKDRLTALLFSCWLFFLLPVLQVYSNTHSYVSERYLYVSMVFPVSIVYLVLKELGVKPNTFRVALVMLTPLFVMLTIKRSQVWTSSQTLFQAELKRDHKNPYALNNLGHYYNSQGQFARGYNLLHQAVEIDSENAYYLNNYGWALAGLGKTDSAIVYFQRSLVSKKDFIDALDNLGICYIQKKQNDKAFNCFERAYILAPDNNEVLYNLGAYYLKTGQNAMARPLIRRAYELGNQAAAPYLNY